MENESPNTVTDRKRQKSVVIRDCVVCGAAATYSYFGAVSCNPCKMFFKRNASTGLEELKCDFDGKCEININNRHVCSYCRLRKCFDSGMQIEMLRGNYSKRSQPNKRRKNGDNATEATSTALCQLTRREHIHTLNLLQNDVSTLTLDQWNLLSNLTHCYDENCGLELGHRFMNEQNSLPVKYRFKAPAMLNYFMVSIEISQSIYQNNHDFLSLAPDDRSLLLSTTLRHIASLSANFIYYQIGLLDNPIFFHTVAMVTHESVAETNRKVAERIRMDPILTKLALAIMSFSTINYTTYLNGSLKSFSNIKQILDIQNRYIEIAWQYLLYKWGYKQAIICISDLVRCLFAVTKSIYQSDDLTHFNDKFESIIERTEQCLNLVN